MMNLERKLFHLVQEKYDDAESISRAALIGLSPAVNRNMINSLALDPCLRVKDKDGRIVPIILVTEEISIQQNKKNSQIFKHNSWNLCDIFFELNILYKKPIFPAPPHNPTKNKCI